MLTLYPAIKPNDTYKIPVDDLHTLYVEESGNPNGIPIVVLHGGPGAGTSPEQRRFFDPMLYRIILFDQRGCGQSTPHAELARNTTQDLINDMEVIRQKLKIDRWVLFGGSWGSTLALAYAQAHPKQVLSMILRGIFLCRNEDFTWFYEAGGASRLFPEAWENFIAHIPQIEGKNIMQSAYQVLTGPDEVARMSVAKAWSQWEGVCSNLLPNNDTIDHFAHVALSLARIETHYFLNNAFLKPNQILDNTDRLADIPGILVHGRYDIVCPLDNAYALNLAWPKSELRIIPAAGHSAFEPGIASALVMATREIAQLHSQ